MPKAWVLKILDLLSMSIAEPSLNDLRRVKFSQSREQAVKKSAGNLNSLRQKEIKEIVILNTLGIPRNFITKEEVINL